jgi:hypothetical protein
MHKNPRDLLNYREYHHSLAGEAGIVNYILSKIPNRDNWVVEFGACDGFEFSNIAHLIQSGSINAVLIEPQDDFYRQLISNMKPFPKVHCIQKMVTLTEGSTLDTILSATPIPIDFDLLVIDIDNNDYQIFESLQKFQPKIFMVEINNTFSDPNHEKISTYDAPFVFGKHGSSLFSMTKLAESKGYKLICNVSCNAVYVKAEFYNLFFSSNFGVNEFYTYEGVSVSRLNELKFTQIFIKAKEAIRREWVSTKNKTDSFLGIFHILKRFISSLI